MNLHFSLYRFLALCKVSGLIFLGYSRALDSATAMLYDRSTVLDALNIPMHTSRAKTPRCQEGHPAIIAEYLLSAQIRSADKRP